MITVLENLVRTVSVICEADLIDLAEKRIIALRMPGFINQSVAQRLASLMRCTPYRRRYQVEPGLSKVGVTFFESNGDAEARDNYHHQAQNNIEFLRRLCHGLVHPIDMLRDQLQFNSTAGVYGEHIDGRLMAAGVCRIFEPGSGLAPRQDMLTKDAPYAQSPRELVSQLAVNIHLSTAELGGELTLWGESYSPAEYDSIRIPGRSGVDEHFLPPPLATIIPEVGELIAFNSTCVHAIRIIKRGEQMSFAAFLGYRGLDRPWSLWS